MRKYSKLVPVGLLLAQIVFWVLYVNPLLYLLPLALGIVAAELLTIYAPKHLNDRYRRVFWIIIGVTQLAVLTYAVRNHDFAKDWQFLIDNWLFTLMILYLPLFMIACLVFPKLKRLWGKTADQNGHTSDH